MPNERYQSYIICTSPRSGSTLLCGLLKATGKAGIPDSHFHNPALSRWLETYGLTQANFASDREALAAIFKAARQQGAGNTKLFGLRLQRGSFDFFMQQLGILHPGLTTDVSRIEAAFGPTLFIHLTRPNKLDQAISRVKATQTGLWHKASDGTELERLSPSQDPLYDADEIARHLAELTDLDDAWKAWFDQENLQPLHVSYDELSRDPTGILRKILNALGLDPAIASDIIPPTARLADTTNQTWAKRFLAEQNSRQTT